MRVKEFRPEEYNYSDRRFQLLFYQVSHGEMIIRSHKNDTVRNVAYEHTLDIYLGNVTYMELPWRMDGICFRKPNSKDVEYLNTRIDDRVTEDEIIVIQSGEKEYYVVASVISVIENDLSFVELPIHCFVHGPEAEGVKE